MRRRVESETDDVKFDVKERYSNWQKCIVRTIIVNAHSRIPLQRSIASAISIAKPYDRIELIGGDYLESLSIPFPLEIVASEGEEPHIVSRNTAVTVTADIKVYFENIQMTSKSKNKLEVGAAVFNGEPTFVDCKFSSVLVGAKGKVSLENCTIRKSSNGVGVSIRDEASGVMNKCTVNTHTTACVEINTRGTFTFTNCNFSNRRIDSGDVFVASGLGNKYGEFEPCSHVTLFHCRLYISQDGGPVKNAQKETASFAVGDPCCVVISNGAAPTLDQNRILEGEVGVLLHHAGSARLTHNLIQSQRRCGIAALLQPLNKESDLEENVFGHIGLKITGDNIIDRCYIGVDIHTRNIPKGPGEGPAEEETTFTKCSGGVHSFSWFDMEGVKDAKLPHLTGTKPKAVMGREDLELPVRAHGRRMSLQHLKYQLRELANIALRAFPACLDEHFGERVSSNATSGLQGNFFSQLLATSVDLEFTNETDSSYVSPLEEFSNEISVSHTIFNHCGLCAIRFGCNSYGCIEQCTFDANDQHAIIVSSGAYPVITGCTFYKSSRSSIFVGGYANPLVLGNEIKDGGRDGIEVTTLGRGIYIANWITSCNGFGVTVDEQSDPLVCGNVIKRNIGGGIHIDRSSSPLVAFNVLSVNSNAQIKYLRDSHPTITRNSVQSGLSFGIVAANYARGIITRNHVISNKWGISIESFADPLIVYNNIEKNNDIGVRVHQKGLGSICHNEIVENGTNVVVMEGGDCVLRANSILKGGQGGVVVQKEGRGLVEKNALRENVVANLIIVDPGSNPRCDQNTICGSTGCGVIAASASEGTIINNSIFENGLCGIYVRTLANPLCIENHISREAVGVMVSENGKGKFIKNEINRIYGMGFVCQRKGHPHVEENVLTSCDFCAVQLGAESAGLYERNRIVENRFGVQIGSSRSVDDLPVTSAYYSPSYDLSQRRKSQMLLAGIRDTNLHLATMRNNDIQDNAVGGVLLQSAVDCVLEENRIFHNGSYGILGDTKYWDKHPIKMPANAYSYVAPRSSHSSHHKRSGIGTHFNRNHIYQHELVNVHLESFLDFGAFLNDNDIFDAPVGISVANSSCLEGGRNNRVRDCLDGVQLFSGGHGTFSGNCVSNCAYVGLYLYDNGRPEWDGENVIEHCHVCGILSDAGAGGRVRKSTVRQCPVGVIALCAVGAPFKARATSSQSNSQFRPSATTFEENDIMEHTIHGVVLLCTSNETPFRSGDKKIDGTSKGAHRLGFSQSANQHVQLLRNTIKSNRVCGIYMDRFDVCDVEPRQKKELPLSELSSRATVEALLGTSMLGTTKEHHDDRARAEPFLEGNTVVGCSIGVSIGSMCHPFMKNNLIVENIFLGVLLRSGSAAMIYGGQVSRNGLAGVYSGKGAKGTVSDASICLNNSLGRPKGVPAAKRDFSRTALVTVLGLWESAKRRVSEAAPSVTNERKKSHAAGYQILQMWLTVQRYAMTETVTLIRQLASAASDGIGIATALVPARKPERGNMPDAFGFTTETRPSTRLLSIPDGGIGVWAEIECRTTFQRNRIEQNHQAGVFYGKGIRSFHHLLQRTSPLDEVTSTSSTLMKEWDEEARANPGSASMFPGAFFTSESLFSHHIPHTNSHRRASTPPKQTAAYVDPSENEFTPIKTGRLNLSARGRSRMTPREMRDNQRSMVLEQNKIQKNTQGIHIQLFHSMTAVNIEVSKIKTKKSTNERKTILTDGPPKRSFEEPEPYMARSNAEYVLHVRDNAVHDNLEVGIYCEHVVELQCQDSVSCSLAFTDAIEKYHRDICQEWTRCTLEGKKATPPLVELKDFPFTIADTAVSGRRSAKLSGNDLCGNRIAQGEVTSQYIIIARDNSKSLLLLDTFATPHSCYHASQVLYRVPHVAALFQRPPPGTFMWEDNTVHDSSKGICCFGVLSSDNARLCRNMFHHVSDDAVMVLGHMASATVAEENSFRANGVGVRIHVDVPPQESLPCTALDYQTRVVKCTFSEQKRQAVVVSGSGSIPVLVFRNTFTNHGYGAVAMLLSSANSTEGSAIVKENQFRDNFSPLVVVGEDRSKEAVLGKSAEGGRPLVDSERLLVAQNHFCDNVIGAIICNGGTPRFFRNTFSGNTRAGIEICGAATFPLIEECIFKRNTTARGREEKMPTYKWTEGKADLELEGIGLPIIVSLANQYTIGSKTKTLSSGILLNPESQATTKRCAFVSNDVGIDAVRCVIPPDTERQAVFTECIFRQHHVAGVMVRFSKTARIRESALSLSNGNIPKENTVVEKSLFMDNASDDNAGLGDVVSREFGAAVFRRNIMGGTVQGMEDGFAWFDSNTFLPEDVVRVPSECAFVLHNDTKIVGTNNTIGKRKTGIESRSYSVACMSENLILQCAVGIRALPCSGSKFAGNRILDTVNTAIVAYSGEFVENQIVFSKNGIWVEDATLSKASNAIPANRQGESKIIVAHNRVCSCDGEGILVSTSGDIAHNIVQLCGIGIHVIGIGKSSSEKEDEWPLIRSNSIFLNREGVVAENNSVSMIRDNDIFDNTSVAVIVQLAAVGKLQANRISTSKEEDALSSPMEAKMKLINNTIKHRFSPVFNRSTNIVRKKEITSFVNSVSREIESWSGNWTSLLEQHKLLEYTLSALEKSFGSEEMDNLLSVAAGAPIKLREFSMTSLNFANSADNKEKNELSFGSLHSDTSNFKARRRRSSSILNGSGLVRERSSVHNSESNHVNRAARRGNAVPFVLHIVTRESERGEAEQWGHDVARTLARPPLSQMSFSVRMSSGRGELEQHILSCSTSSIFLVLIHKSCTAPASAGERKALEFLHQTFAEQETKGAERSPLLLAFAPEDFSLEDHKEGDRSATGTLSSAFSCKMLKYKENVSEVFESLTDAILQWSAQNGTEDGSSSLPPRQHRSRSADPVRSSILFARDGPALTDEELPLANVSGPLRAVRGLPPPVSKLSLSNERRKSKTPQKQKSVSKGRKSLSKSKKGLAPAPPNRITTPLPKIKKNTNSISSDA